MARWQRRPRWSRSLSRAWRNQMKRDAAETLCIKHFFIDRRPGGLLFFCVLFFYIYNLLYFHEYFTKRAWLIGVDHVARWPRGGSDVGRRSIFLLMAASPEKWADSRERKAPASRNGRRASFCRRLRLFFFSINCLASFGRFLKMGNPFKIIANYKEDIKVRT